MDDLRDMLFELIRIALGHQDRINRNLSAEEWLKVYQAAVKQSVVGICVEGMSRLPKDQKPPMELFLQWVGIVSQIQQRNEKLDRQTAKIWKQLKDDVIKILRFLRLEKFAGAMMWVIGLMAYGERFLVDLSADRSWMLCEPDEKEGRFLLNEILLSGNFGQADQRYRYKRLFKLQRMLSRGSHLLIHYPSEVIWSPIWIVYHWFWKRKKKREIHKLWQFGS